MVVVLVIFYTWLRELIDLTESALEWMTNLEIKL